MKIIYYKGREIRVDGKTVTLKRFSGTFASVAEAKRYIDLSQQPIDKSKVIPVYF